MHQEKSQIISASQLRETMGYKGANGHLANYLRKKCGIKTFPSPRGPWTTLDIINRAGGIVDKPDADNSDIELA